MKFPFDDATAIDGSGGVDPGDFDVDCSFSIDSVEFGDELIVLSMA